jgi:hypothetical protein
MSSPYTKFLNRERGAAVTDFWASGQSFAVRKAPIGVNYGRTIGGLDVPTFLIDPPQVLDSDCEASMAAPTRRQLPPMPQIGMPESYYAQAVQHADRIGATHEREAAKVGQYITLALDPSLSWEQKLKFFKHALKRHCSPPPFPDDDVWMFYQDLGDLVRQHCGSEALRLASIEDDLFAARERMGQIREKIEEDAERFFQNLTGLGQPCPEWFNESEWSQLKLLRDQWM